MLLDNINPSGIWDHYAGVSGLLVHEGEIFFEKIFQDVYVVFHGLSKYGLGFEIRLN